MTRSKILFIDHTPFVGGAELVLASHIKHLDKSQFAPVVVCSRTVPELVEKFRAAGAKVYPTSFGKLKTLNPLVFWRLPSTSLTILRIIVASLLRSSLQFAFAPRKQIVSGRIDLVVTNTVRAWLPGTIAAKLARRKLIWWIRDFTYPKGLFKLLLPLADHVIFVSEAVKNFYGKARPFGRTGLGKLSVIYVGSDFGERIKKDSRRIKKDEVVIGYVGRLVRWKGPQVLLRAAQDLKLKIKNLKFKILIVGSGEGQEGDVEEELHQMVKDLKLEDQVTFTGQRSDIPALMKTFDIFVHPSIEPEPFATVIVEAMMAGLPVIGTNIGGTPEIIKDGQTGFLVPPNNPQALAEILLKLIGDPDLRKRIGQAGQKLALEKHRESVSTHQVEKIYKMALNQPSCTLRVQGKRNNNETC